MQILTANSIGKKLIYICKFYFFCFLCFNVLTFTAFFGIKVYQSVCFLETSIKNLAAKSWEGVC